MVVKAPESGLYKLNVGLPDKSGNIAEPIGSAPFDFKIDLAEGTVDCSFAVYKYLSSFVLRY